MSEKKDLLNEDDLEYELERIEAQKAALEEEKNKKAEKENERREYEKRLQEERLELIKLKNGDITDSEIIKEEHDINPPLHGNERVKNFRLHNK